MRKCELVQLEIFNFEEDNFIELPLAFSTPKLSVASETNPCHEDGVTVTEISVDVGLLSLRFRQSKNGGPAGSSMAHLVQTEALNILKTLFEQTLHPIDSFRFAATWSSMILCSQ